MIIPKKLIGVALLIAAILVSNPLYADDDDDSDENDVGASLKNRVEALETQVSANSDAIAALEAGALAPVQVLANGESVGTFLQARNIGTTLFSTLSNTGYYFDVIASVGSSEGEIWPARLFYAALDCSSPAFVRTGPGGFLNDTLGSAQQGVVILAPSTGLFYVPAGTQVAVRSFASSDTGAGCNFGNGAANVHSAEALPNNPTITGVPNTPFAAPITIGQ